MHDFGSFTAYSDPRIYGLIENYRWGDFQRSLLLGQHSWVSSTWGTDRRGFRLKACNVVVHCLHERGIKTGMSENGVALIRVDLPVDDPTLPMLLAQCELVIPKVSILVLEGPSRAVRHERE